MHDIERLGQYLRQGREQLPFAPPRVALIAPRLQLFQVAPAGAIGIGVEALIANPSFNLSLRLRLAWRASVDVKAHDRGVADGTSY
jgi:hypothetical protein